MSRLLRKSPAIIVAVVLAGRLIAAEPVEWKVVSVHDGDTLTAVDARKVRLQEIDAPETKQAFGTTARNIATTCPRYVAESFRSLGKRLTPNRLDRSLLLMVGVGIL